MSPRILIVEGNGNFRRFLSSFVTKMGYSVELADGSEQALELFSRGRFQTVLIGNDLPDPIARKMIAELRMQELEAEREELTPLVGFAPVELRERYIAAGIDVFVEKDGSTDRLRRTLAEQVPLAS